MKVLVSTLGGDGGKSGISQYISNLMREFPQVLPDIRFDVLAFPGEEQFYVTDPGRMNVLPLSESLRNPLRSLLWQQTAIPRLCAKTKYDLVFFPAANRRLSYWVPCPSVGTFHDLAILHIRDKYDWFHSLYSLRLLPVMVRRLTAVITDSICSKHDLVNFIGIPEERVRVITPGVDSKRFYPRDRVDSTSHIQNRYGIKPPYLLYISRIEHPGKNHVRLIRAFDQLKTRDGLPHQLVLAGSDWTGSDTVHKEAVQSAAGNDIVFPGFVNDEDIPHLYCSADAFVFPSLFEGFGLPVLEAMASGVPVVCSNASSLPEVAGDAAILFDPLDMDELTHSLRQVLTDQNLRSALAEKGLQRAQLFSWEATARSTAEVFLRAVTGAD